MFFLLRMTFWLGLVLILLPSGVPRRGPAAAQAVGAADAISAASATVADLRGFCTRQPQACVVGSQIATAIGHKAQAGAETFYDVLTDALASRRTGSLASGAPRTVSDRASQDTLTPADLVPAWRGPPPQSERVRRNRRRAA